MNETPEDPPPPSPEPSPYGLDPVAATPGATGAPAAAIPAGGKPSDAAKAAPEPRRSWLAQLIHDIIWLPARIVRNANELWEENKLLLIILAFGFLFLVAMFWQSIFVVIGPGEGGVLYRLFLGGTEIESHLTTDKEGAEVEEYVQTSDYYREGLHVIFPWDTMYIYNLRLQQVPDSFYVLSKDGLAIKVEVSIRFRPEKARLGLLHQRIGPDYIERVVKPDVQSVCRYVFGQYKPDEIYDTQGLITELIKQDAMAHLAAHFVDLDDVLLRSVTLPPTVASAIESKLRAQQLMEEYTYRVESERKEAERKGIEADGIRAFQDKSMASLPDFEQYLHYKGIEATLELAKSPNSKIVIIGGGEDRLPIILDGSERGSVPVDTGAAGTPRSPKRP
jgi:regulator of protease activity HflC (stomatin/prohibitin superfamily)